ncbi:MAG: ABC transporter ATP-binding protein [Methylobacterium sp.]|nr:ABC transporter ATP-binding protein [Methylobacterium sp.]MCE2933757.1 ABC transporter ATP-binding protein [Hyphomicrobiales bacterium]MCA3655617.1 ABC transporter ATP-binding protein [Methylobacterium sp.]MCA3656738.1 ABC transporter ATP-binding protein [Methylobacterium sp.]MCA3664661.1 ABC transporter ATP-binding protein [Methylobacterium sp.]
MRVETPLLAVENLRVRFHTPTRIVEAVRGLSFTLGREKLAIVGESGSGKSMTGRAILDLVPWPGEVSADRMEFRGQEMMGLDRHGRRAIRGKRISMVMQDPKFSLNPVMTVGQQIGEAYRVHTKASRSEARERALAMLEAVQIREPARVHDLYPHEVSGGMGQRVMIAMMLIGEPDILIADEPTSALDVTVQAQVLDILERLVTDRGMGLIFISHDLPLVASFCDRVVVMYAGRVMETLDARALSKGKHPYTRGLLGCLPDLDHPKDRLATLKRDPAWANGAGT